MKRALVLLVAALVAVGCNLYNPDMWDGCPPADGLTWDPEGEPQCGYTTASLEAGGTVANGCTMMGFTATGEHRRGGATSPAARASARRLGSNVAALRFTR